jgi:hypothetical protein
MKFKAVFPVLVLALPALCIAGDLERDLKSQWLGAWVVTSVETYSDCTGNYTNNRVNGNLVKSRGSQRFLSGELAKVVKISAKKSRVDVHLALAEPLLLPYLEGPFTLYREAHCRVELEVVVPREVVREKDASRIDASLRLVLERYATENGATNSPLWNGREREPYPDDYDQTLSELDIWRAEQTNAAVRAQLDHAREETSRLADRVSGDPDYLAGFAKGVEDARAVDLRACTTMLGLELESKRRRNERTKNTEDTSEARESRGFEDGRKLILGLELMRRLPSCFVAIPDRPAAEAVFDKQASLSSSPAAVTRKPVPDSCQSLVCGHLRGSAKLAEINVNSEGWSSRRLVNLVLEALHQVVEVRNDAQPQVILDDSSPSIAAQPLGESPIAQDLAQRARKGIEVPGVLEQQSAHSVLDLVANPANRTGDHRPGLPHRLRHGQAEALAHALLHHHRGVTL